MATSIFGYFLVVNYGVGVTREALILLSTFQYTKSASSLHELVQLRGQWRET